MGPGKSRWWRWTLSLLALVTLTGCGITLPWEDRPPTVDYEARGPITVLLPADTSGVVKQQVEQWNQDHPNEIVTVVDQTGTDLEQHQVVVDNADEGMPKYSVVSIDGTWQQGLASAHSIVPFPSGAVPTEGFIASTVSGTTYRGHHYAVPTNPYVGTLFYRVDWLRAAGVESVPKTFPEMQAVCQSIKEKVPAAENANCYGVPLEPNEDFTAATLELMYAAGETIVAADGTPHGRTDQMVAGFQSLKDLIAQGTIPSDARGWTAAQTRDAFAQGELIFMRNWNTVAADLQDPDSEVVNRFGIAAVPGGRGVVGVRSLVLPTTGPNLGTAVDFVSYLSGEQLMQARMDRAGLVPTRAALYTDFSLTTKTPYLPMLQRVVANGRPRPAFNRYPEASQVIQQVAAQVVAGTLEPSQAADDLSAQLKALVEK